MFNFSPRTDTAQIQQKVQADINNAQSKKWDRNTFLQKVKNYSTKYNTDLEKSYDIVLWEAEKQGYIIEWYNDSPEQIQSQVRQESKGKIGQFFSAIWNRTKEWVKDFFETPLAAATQIPETAGSIAGGGLKLLSKIMPNAVELKVNWQPIWEKLGQAIQNLWVDSTEKLRELLWVDPDSFNTKLWSFATDIWGSLLIPTWKLGQAPKIVQTGLANLQTKAPTIYNLLTSAGRWALEAGKFDIASEWEVSTTSLAIWAVSNPVLSSIGKFIKWTGTPEQILRSITWVKPSEVKKLWYKTIKEDADIVVKSIKEYLNTPIERNINGKIVQVLPDAPKTRWELLELLQNRQKDIYEKHILPLLKKAGQSGEVKLSWLTDDIIGKLYPRVKWVSLMEWLGWKTDEMAQITNFWKNIEKQSLSFEELEIMKSALSASLKQWWNPNVVAFLWQVNKRLQEQYDDLLSKATGQWVKTLKREYAAIANMKEPLYAKVAQEMRDSGMDLVWQLWLYSTILQWVKWDIRWAARSFLSLKILQKLRDPNTALRNMIEQIYWKEQSTKIIDTLIGIGASETWKVIDNDF